MIVSLFILRVKNLERFCLYYGKTLLPLFSVDELLSKLKTEEDKVKAAYSNVEGKIDR